MTKICHCPKNQKGDRKEGLTSEVERNVKNAALSALSMRPIVQDAKSTHTHVGGSKFVTAFLISAIVLLMSATSWLAYSKFNKRSEVGGPIITHKPDYITKNDAEKMMVQIQDRIDGLEQQMQMWNHRSWLLALAVNENANISQRVDNCYHRCYPHSGFITFDRNWNVNKIPNTMHLSEEEKRKIFNGVK